MIVGKSVVWIPQAGLMFYVWVIFLGIAPLFFKGEQIRVEYFVNLLPKKYVKIDKLLVHILDIIFFSIILYFTPKLISLQLSPDIVLPVPRYFYSIPLLITSVTVILIEINNILCLIFGDQFHK